MNCLVHILNENLDRTDVLPNDMLDSKITVLFGVYLPSWNQEYAVILIVCRVIEGNFVITGHFML